MPINAWKPDNPYGARIDNDDFSANLKNNNTPQLVEDLERLRQYLQNDLGLNAEKMLVSGGSWGTTLAIEYAKKYPQRVSGLCLTGLFLGDQRSISNIMGDGLINHPDEVIRMAYANQIRLAIDHASNGPEIEDQLSWNRAPNYKDLADAYFELLSDFRRPAIRLKALQNRMIIDYLLEGGNDPEEGAELSNPKYFTYNRQDQTMMGWQANKILHDLIKMHFVRHNLWLDPKKGVLAGIDALEVFRKRDVPVYINRSPKDPFLPKWVTADFIEGNIPNASVLNRASGVHHAPADIMEAIALAQRDLMGSSEKPNANLQGTCAAIYNHVTGLYEQNRPKRSAPPIPMPVPIAMVG